MAKVFLACPLYDGRLHIGAAHGLFAACSQRHSVKVCADSCSLLSLNCNRHWATALNMSRSHGYTWFGMLHSDIEPQDWWLDTLIETAEANSADIVSAIVPLKDMSGHTSTAISTPGELFHRFAKLTLAQVNHAAFPEAFDIHAAATALENLPELLRMTSVPRESLLVNTGCFVCRLDRPWCELVAFEVTDQISMMGNELTALGRGEDWHFSHRIAQEGGKVMATTKVRVKHHGSFAFDSSQVWGNPRDVS